jgi:hypothetical protein
MQIYQVHFLKLLIPKSSFYFVPIQVTHKAAIVWLTIVGSATGRTFVYTARCQCCLIESMDGFFRGSDKTDMRAVANGCRLFLLTWGCVAKTLKE